MNSGNKISVTFPSRTVRKCNNKIREKKRI